MESPAEDAIRERFRTVLELYELAEEMMRAKLRREQHPRRSWRRRNSPSR
jgi:hypothetical protein